MAPTASPYGDGGGAGPVGHASVVLSSSPDLSSPPRSDSDAAGPSFTTKTAPQPRPSFGRDVDVRSSATGSGLGVGRGGGGGPEVSSSSATNVHDAAASATTRSGLRQSNTTTTAPKRASRKRDRTDDAGDTSNTTSKIKTSSATKTTTTKVGRPRKVKEGAVAKKRSPRYSYKPKEQQEQEQEKQQAQQPQQPQQPQQTQRPQPPQQTPSSRKTAISHLVDSDVPSGREASSPPQHHHSHRHHEDEYNAGSGSAEATQAHRRYDAPSQYQSPSRHDPYQAQYAYGTSSQPAAGTTAASPPPRTSGTKYDPIRSVSMEGNAPPPERTRSISQNLSPVKTSKASASPSISSLIDPPSTTTTTTTAPPMTIATTRVSVAPGGADPVQPSLPTRFVAVSSDAPDPLPKAEHRDRPRPSRSAAADEHDGAVSAPPTAASKAPKKESADTSAGGSTRNSSPKPGRQKETPAPASGPTGSGLLSSALFGGPASTSAQGSADNRPPTIVIELTLRTEKDRYINFARLAEERYGFNAIHPGLATQRDRLARAAVAGATAERASGLASADEMSLDGSEPESNGGGGGVGGVGTEGSGDNGDQKPKRKRKTKADAYNKDDPFIDDSEMVWQEQAAASKDGFFVYEGPLIKPGERPTVERGGGAAKRGRGRGRGGGTRGGASNRGGRDSSGGTGPSATGLSATGLSTTGSGTAGAGSGAGTAAATVGSSTSGTGGKTGSTRGSGTVRKPRITKAERARREQESHDREKNAPLAARPVSYVG
ncbi:MAG: hypothetical protein M1815_000513 [Lichina confinis]|nr:MAG: hypothetical protein M1815_000513 [Lichina confinis]